MGITTEHMTGSRPAGGGATGLAGAVAGVGALQWLLAALLVGSGAVHLALAPSHVGESAVVGTGFLVAGWLQLGLAAAVVVRPGRWTWSAVMGLSLALIGAWAVSRTAGLPFGGHGGHAESVTAVDGVTVAMEAVSVVLAGLLLAGRGRDVRSRAWSWAAAAAVLVVASVVLTTPSARDHAEAAHGDHGQAENGHEHGVEVAGGAAVDGATGPAAEEALPADHHHGEATAVELDGREVTGVKAEDIAAEELPNEPLEAATRRRLARQLVVAREVAMRYPTVADATAAGYWLVGGFGPGAGAHYLGGALGFGGMGEFDPASPASLIYDGTSPTSSIVGLMYTGGATESPSGFVGPNDHWHRHSGVCIAPGDGMLDVLFPVDADVTAEQCAEAGGSFMDRSTWMVHAWVVPGWESPSGVFSHANPDVRCADGTYDTDEIGRCQGT